MYMIDFTYNIYIDHKLTQEKLANSNQMVGLSRQDGTIVGILDDLRMKLDYLESRRLLVTLDIACC